MTIRIREDLLALDFLDSITESKQTCWRLGSWPDHNDVAFVSNSFSYEYASIEVPWYLFEEHDEHRALAV